MARFQDLEIIFDKKIKFIQFKFPLYTISTKQEYIADINQFEHNKMNRKQKNINKYIKKNKFEPNPKTLITFIKTDKNIDIFHIDGANNLFKNLDIQTQKQKTVFH